MDPEYVLLAVVVSILPVLIPEVRQWYEVIRDRRLDERVAMLEQEIIDLNEVPDRPMKRGRRKNK